MSAQLQLVSAPPLVSKPASTAPAIEVDDLSLYFGGKAALDRLSLSIPQGGIHAIVGANGAGKSSLFRVLLGFQSPSSGQARILQRDSARLNERDRARIGFVNEEHSLPAWLRVAEVVAMQRRLYPQWNAQRYANIVGHFNVLPEQRVRELSRGERAGLNLAMAMAQSPELLILDEPTLGLDVVAKRAFLECLLEAVAESDSTIIYCSHQMEEIERLADNLIVLERGRLIHMSPPEEFCQRVSLWVADFGLTSVPVAQLPGLLQQQKLDGLSHLLVLDADSEFGARLEALGARRHYRGEVSLDRAVNAMLTRNHAAPSQPLAD